MDRAYSILVEKFKNKQPGGSYLIAGVGKVFVSDELFEAARLLGGQVSFLCIRAWDRNDVMPVYRAIRAEPAEPNSEEEEEMEPNTEVSEKQPVPKNEVFVIHGRNAAITKSVYSFLRCVNIKPIEWQRAVTLTNTPTPTIWQIVDTALTRAAAIIVLFTPDDEAKLRNELLKADDGTNESELTPQPRQNVLFEAGVAFGRNPQRTLIVQIGKIRPISDLAGHYMLRLNNSVNSRLDFIARLRNAGCEVDMEGGDWAHEGNFEWPEPASTPDSTIAPQVNSTNASNSKTHVPNLAAPTNAIVPAPFINTSSVTDMLFADPKPAGPPLKLTQWQHIQVALENMKFLMVNRANGGSPSNDDYVKTRAYLLKMIGSDSLPSIVVKYRTVAEFWAYIQPKAAKYRERTTIIQDEFADIMTYVEKQIFEGH